MHAAISSWIFRPSDLKNVMLASKAFCELAMPSLYRDVYIDIADTSHKSLLPLLSQGHSGHKHIRSVNVVCCNFTLRGVSLRAMKDLLTALPQDLLEEFRYVVPSLGCPRAALTAEQKLGSGKY